MEKTASSLSAAKETKEQEETVKAICTSSASVIDVSHHLRNISQFDKSLVFSPVSFSARARKGAEDINCCGCGCAARFGCPQREAAEQSGSR